MTAPLTRSTFARPSRPKLSWPGLLALLLFSGTVGAESGAYRIEILVFRYLDSMTEPREVEQIRRFPESWSLFEPRAVVYPEDPAPLGVVSERMRSVWRRLENAGDIEPLFLQTWEQSRIDYQPPVRIHDDQVLLERVELPERWADIDLTMPDFFAPYREKYYRLDGTAQLRRSRFLHLEFDLEFRVALLPPVATTDDPGVVEATDPDRSVKMIEPRVFDGRPDPAPRTANDGSADGERSTVVLRPPPWWNPVPPLIEPMPNGQAPLPGVALHRLRESRQIRTDELMYFDTPYLGVIARVTATAGE
jgi:hypothetical protein